MATKKDLVEAYSFSRRRLVTAFVSGAPGGREVEPARPGRMIVGGAALAVLLVAGAAVAGALTSSAPVRWDRAGLVTDDRGALYVILDKDRSPGQPALRPVINVTSAQLILGSGEKARGVGDDDLAEQRKGPTIGILDAPATPPAADRLLNSGWTSCTGTDQGMRTVVAASPDLDPAADRAFVVASAGSGARWLIVEAASPRLPQRAYRYALPDRQDDGLLAAVAGATPQDVVTVPDAWLALFPEGAPLSAQGLGIPGLGRPAGLEGYPGARVGDVVRRDSLTYAITLTGLVALTPFAEQVLSNTDLGGTGAPRVIDAAPGAPVEIVAQPFADARWPERPVTSAAPATAELCAVLRTEEDRAPAVRLAIAPEGSDLAEPVPGGTSPVQVESSRGAVVRVGGFDDAEARTVYLLDDRGRTYPLAGKVEIANLGFDAVRPVVVPDAWNRLFVPGPELSQAAALCPPVAAADAPATEASPTCP